MFEVAKNFKHVDETAAPSREISSRVEPNTSTWRKRVKDELDARGRGARAGLVRHLKARHPAFSTGHLTDTLADDEKQGQKRYSQYVSEINRYLWPSESTEIDERLMQVLRSMDRESQRALADTLTIIRKPK